MSRPISQTSSSKFPATPSAVGSGAAPVGPSAPARAFWIPVLVAFAAATVGFALVWMVRDQLPDPVARHWGADGRPDGFSPLRLELVTDVALTLAPSALMLGLGAAMRQLRAVGPIAAAMSVFVAVVGFGGLFAQRGLASATEARSGAQMWLGFLAGIAVGLLVWLAVRDTSRHRATGRPSTSAPRVPVAASTRVAWTGSTRSGAGVWVAAVLGLLPTTVMGVVFWRLGSRSVGVLMLLLTLAMAALLSNLRCRVSVDGRGVRALGLGVIPWVRIGLDEIEQAGLATVSPLGDFGGWGYRAKLDRSGAWGLVTSAGEAMVIGRAGKGPLYITVDGAAEAVAVLNTRLARREADAAR